MLPMPPCCHSRHAAVPPSHECRRLPQALPPQVRQPSRRHAAIFRRQADGGIAHLAEGSGSDHECDEDPQAGPDPLDEEVDAGGSSSGEDQSTLDEQLECCPFCRKTARILHKCASCLRPHCCGSLEEDSALCPECTVEERAESREDSWDVGPDWAGMEHNGHSP